MSDRLTEAQWLEGNYPDAQREHEEALLAALDLSDRRREVLEALGELHPWRFCDVHGSVFRFDDFCEVHRLRHELGMANHPGDCRSRMIVVLPAGGDDE